MKTKTFLLSALAVAFTACLAFTGCDGGSIEGGLNTGNEGEDGGGNGNGDWDITDLYGEWDQTWIYGYEEGVGEANFSVDEAANFLHYEFVSGGTGYGEVNSDHFSFSWKWQDERLSINTNMLEDYNDREYVVEELTPTKLVVSMTDEGLDEDNEEHSGYYRYTLEKVKGSGGNGKSQVISKSIVPLTGESGFLSSITVRQTLPSGETKDITRTARLYATGEDVQGTKQDINVTYNDWSQLDYGNFEYVSVEHFEGEEYISLSKYTYALVSPYGVHGDGGDDRIIGTVEIPFTYMTASYDDGNIKTDLLRYDDFDYRNTLDELVPIRYDSENNRGVYNHNLEVEVHMGEDGTDIVLTGSYAGELSFIRD